MPIFMQVIQKERVLGLFYETPTWITCHTKEHSMSMSWEEGRGYNMSKDSKEEKKQEAEERKPINESKTKSISEEVRCCKLKLSLVANTCS